jgi:toxin ParE1/3/4
MSRYSIADKARDDLDGIWDYIAIENHNVDAADRLIDTIEEAFKLLAEHKLMGERRPDMDDLIPAVRSFTVGSYVIYYQPIAQGIHVGRVIHGHRDQHVAISE